MLFSVFGYDNTGVQKIAQVCGVSKPTIYHYFGSKDGILYELFKSNLDDFIEELSKESEYNFDVRSTLENVTECFFRFAQKKPDFCKFFLYSDYAPEESDVNICSFTFRKKIYDIINNIFLRAEQDHGNMKGRNKKYTISFLGTLYTYIIMSFSQNLEIELDKECKSEVVRQFLYGIFS
jgi:TetR/AcrR family transcriptional regulator